MNNKEKREYIDCLALLDQNCYIAEIEKRNEVLGKSPSVLYKYRAFDKYTSEMIKKNYVYLSPVKSLDDPFDCISDFELKGLYSEQKGAIKSNFINYVIKTVDHNLNAKQVSEIKKLLIDCLDSDGINRDKAIPKLISMGMSYDEANKIILFFCNSLNVFETYDDYEMFDQFATIAYNPGDLIGVCSLSEIRDNKVMWSLYGKKYKGYCIEYEIPFNKDVRKSLFPVFYSKRMSNSFVIKMYDTIMAQVKRYGVHRDMFTMDPQIENVGAIYDLFCLKDTDWKYQREWRLLGKAKGHYGKLKIRAIYLGFNVSKTNEEKMRRLSKKYSFELYKMNPPTGKKTIRYSRINNGTTRKSN